MSTLTKVLIVLLTLASIFLCGTVATYFTNAVDYKEKYDRQYSSYQAAERRADNAETNFNKLKDDTDKEKLDLNNTIAALQDRINGLNADLKQCQIDRDDARRKEDKWEATAARRIQRCNCAENTMMIASLSISQLNCRRTWSQ